MTSEPAEEDALLPAASLDVAVNSQPRMLSWWWAGMRLGCVEHVEVAAVQVLQRHLFFRGAQANGGQCSAPGKRHARAVHPIKLRLHDERGLEVVDQWDNDLQNNLHVSHHRIKKSIPLRRGCR